LEQEQNNWKVVEQTLTFTEKIFISTKGKVEQLDGQNESPKWCRNINWNYKNQLKKFDCFNKI
jgi:hypothetical protein